MEPESEPEPEPAALTVQALRAERPDGEGGEADSLRQTGNGCFREGKFDEAISLYSQALNQLESVPAGDTQKQLQISCLLNRAACCLKIGGRECHERVVVDCTQVISLEYNNVKALFRRGQAYSEMKQLNQAKSDLLAAAKLAPRDKAIREHYERVKGQA
eukprot:SAG11_NODE_11551_length_753_cov_0.859327_1_plen_159_part_10